MRAICVDDEELILNRTVAICRELPQLDKVDGFLESREALSFIEKNRVDLCLLDIDMPEIDGITLAARIKAVQPDVAIIFVTGYSEYAVDAFGLHASGYLLKPVVKERLAAEVEFALAGKGSDRGDRARITVQTFGGFDVFVDGKLVSFKRSKAKKLLAYLVDRRGSSVTAANAFAALYEDAEYDRSRQKQFYVIIHSLRQTLAENDMDEIFEMAGGTMRVVPGTFDCDLYRFLEGDADAVAAYRGEYMINYAWASETEGFVTARWEK